MHFRYVFSSCSGRKVLRFLGVWEESEVAVGDFVEEFSCGCTSIAPFGHDTCPRLNNTKGEFSSD